MVVGYAPGFLLPFILSERSTPTVSDSALLAVSVGTTVASIIGLSLENSWAAHFAAALDEGKGLSRRTVVAGVSRAMLMTLPVSLLLLVIFSAPSILVSSDEVRSLLGAGVLAIALLPSVVAGSSVSAGIMNASGKVGQVVALQGARGLVAVFAVLGVSGTDELVVIVPLSLIAGEAIRLVLSGLFVARCTSEPKDSYEKPAPGARGILSQVGSLAILGTAPILDRAFLTSAGVGNVTLLEKADRLFFAANQLGSTLVVLPRIRVVSSKLRKVSDRSVAKGEAVFCFVAASVISGGAAAFLALAAIWTDLIDADLLIWSLILLASAPAAVAGTALTRLLVATDRQFVLPVLATVGVVVNLLGNIVGIALLGPVGVVVSTVVCRYTLLVLSLATFSLRRGDPGGKRR